MFGSLCILEDRNDYFQIRGQLIFVRGIVDSWSQIEMARSKGVYG